MGCATDLVREPCPQLGPVGPGWLDNRITSWAGYGDTCPSDADDPALLHQVQHCPVVVPELDCHLMGKATDLVRQAPCTSLKSQLDPTDSLGLATDFVREPCPELGPAFQRDATSPQQGTPPFGGSAGRPRGRSPGLRRARIRPPAPEADGGIGSMATQVLDSLRGLGDVGACRRSLMKFSRRFFVLLANHLDGTNASDLGAGDGFHTHVRKMTIVNFSLDKAPLARRRSEGVFPLGNASST